MVTMRVADYLVRTLSERGVQTAYLLAGGLMMHLLDALGRVPSLRYYCNHHEQASAMAADAAARLSGRPGLCLATGGPGATNLLTGLVGAWQDSSPVLFLTGQCKRADTMRGTGYMGLRQWGTFEVDMLPIVRSVTKYAAYVEGPGDIRYHLEKAWHRLTSGRPGPVLLDLPLDVQEALIDPDTLLGYEPPPELAQDPVSVHQLAATVLAELRAAQRPLLWAGHGVRASGAVEAFRTLVDTLGVPVVTTQLAKDLLPHAHPLLVGHPGIKGDRAANQAVQTADVLLILGSSLHPQNIGWDATLFAPAARKFHVDPDSWVLRKTAASVTRQIHCCVKAFVDALTIRTAQDPERPPGTPWRHLCWQWKQRYTSAREPHTYGPLDGPANFYEVVDLLSDLLTGNEVLITDAGQPVTVVPQALRLQAGQRYLTPGAQAGMGWALPAAIGAATVQPGRPVVVVVGDGSLATNVQELQTIHHHNLNIKVLVINNSGYASIRSTQDRYFDGFHVGASIASGVSLPDLEKVAHAYALPYVACLERGQLRDRLRETLTTSGPVLCEVVAQYDQVIMPQVGSVRGADGALRAASLAEMSPALPAAEEEPTHG